jgi:hypothetical protein
MPVCGVTSIRHRPSLPCQIQLHRAVRDKGEIEMDPKKFSRIAESLRQYRRADLREFQKELGGGR